MTKCSVMFSVAQGLTAISLARFASQCKKTQSDFKNRLFFRNALNEGLGPKVKVKSGSSMSGEGSDSGGVPESALKL